MRKSQEDKERQQNTKRYKTLKKCKSSTNKLEEPTKSFDRNTEKTPKHHKKQEKTRKHNKIYKTTHQNNKKLTTKHKRLPKPFKRGTTNLQKIKTQIYQKASQTKPYPSTPTVSKNLHPKKTNTYPKKPYIPTKKT